jgi:hypothetical protein
MATQVIEQAKFREVKSEKPSLFILETKADYADSMKILEKNGLRPLTYQDAFSRSSELITELKVKWFYLAGQGLKEDGLYTFDEQGELIKLTGNETCDQKVCVWSGDQPLYLEVDSGGFYGSRFVLYAYGSPHGVAPVVVGIKINPENALPPEVGVRMTEIGEILSSLKQTVA